MKQPSKPRKVTDGSWQQSDRSQPSEIAEPAPQYQVEVTFPDEVTWLIGRQLSQLEESYSEQGRSLADLGSPQELAERMVAAVPRPSPWNEVLGPFYGPGQVAEVLGGISRQAVADRRQRRTLLGLKTADGHWVYPLFQFDARNTVLAGLAETLQILAPSGVDDWSLAGWLTSPLRSLSQRTPIEWLAQGKALETLLDVARDAARRFAR